MGPWVERVRATRPSAPPVTWCADAGLDGFRRTAGVSLTLRPLTARMTSPTCSLPAAGAGAAPGGHCPASLGIAQEYTFATSAYPVGFVGHARARSEEHT